MEEEEEEKDCFVAGGAVGKRLDDDDLDIASLKESLRRQGIGAEREMGGAGGAGVGGGGVITGETVCGGEGVVLVSFIISMTL